jgi:RHS repeat-associated protein
MMQKQSDKECRLKTRYRQMLNKLVCHIILYTFLWVTFAPGFAFAAGTTPSSSGKDKKKAVTKSNLPRNPQEAQKMYAAKEEQRIKKEQARHRAASEALEKKKPQKPQKPIKPEQTLFIIQTAENGEKHVFKYPETVEVPESFLTPHKQSNKQSTKQSDKQPDKQSNKQSSKELKAYSTTPPEEGLYRALNHWPGTTGTVYVDVTPTGNANADRCYAAGFPNNYREDNLHESIQRSSKGYPTNPTGIGNYYIITQAGKRPWTEWGQYYNRVVYHSWLDENQQKWSQYWAYDGDGTHQCGSNLVNFWSSEIEINAGTSVIGDNDVGSWGYRTYCGSDSNQMQCQPGGSPETEYLFPGRAIKITGDCSDYLSPSLEAILFKFQVSYEPDDWNPGTTTFKLRIKSGSTVKKVIECSYANNEIKCQWNGRDSNNDLVPTGSYTVEAMGTSETEYATSYDIKYVTDHYESTAWIEMGDVYVANTEKGVGFQFLNKGEPVNVASGNYYMETKDLAIPARGIPFTITRYHNSLNPHFGFFGPGWSSNISPYLYTLESGNIKIMNPDGEFNLYTKVDDTTYTPMAGVHSTLVKNANGSYTLTHKDKSVTNFNSQGNITGVTDANDNTLTYHYDSSSKLTSISDASARNITFAYDDHPRITKITDFASRETTYEYNSTGHLTKVTDPMGYTNAYSYNNKHQILGVWDARWHAIVTNTYNDTTKKVASQTLADNTQMSYTYDTTARTAVITTGDQSDTYYYDSSDNLTKEVTPLGAETTYAYDSNRNMTSVTDPLSHVTSYEYDSNGNRTKVTDADSNITTTAYDTTFNKPTQITTPLSQVTQFSYDTKGNLTRTTDPLNRDTTMAYDTYGQLTSTTDPLSHTTTCAYDSYGNMTSTTNSLNKTTTFAYDTVGNMTSTTDPLSHTTTKAYNNNNWLTSVAAPLNHTTSFTYDNNGNLTSTQDAMNYYTGYNYDSMNRLTSVQDSASAVTNYYYDSYGNMTRMADARSNSTYYYFDNGNRLTRVTGPLSRNTDFAYDAAGNMTSRTDAKSQTTTLSYDVLNRLTSKSGAVTVSYAYDDVGRRTSMTDSIGTTTYSYNTVNQLTSTTVPGSKTIAYAYNNVGALTSRTDAGGVDTTFEYDNGNRLTRTTRATKVMTYGYDDANRPTNKTYPNGIQGQFSYDNANQLTTASYLNGGTPFWSCQYGYNAVGNRTSKVVGGTTLGYMYDSAHRLAAVSINGPTRFSYEYDAVGNRTIKRINGVPTNYGYDAANQMTSMGSTTYGYDNNGNRTSSVTGGQTTTYAYDGVDRLTRITYPQAGNPYNTFEYNGDGLRVKTRAKTGAITRYVWSGSDVINEYSDNWTLQKSYYLGGGLEGQIAGTTYSYYHQDGLGSVVTITNPSGNVTDTYDYDEFGTQIFNQGTTQNVYRYTGQQSDADSALLYLRARYYEPNTGRFITQDAKKGNPKDPASLNLYVYCKNNPLKYSDPDGYEEQAFGPNDTFVKWNTGSFRLASNYPPSGSKQDKVWKIVEAKLNSDNKALQTHPGWDCFHWRDTYLTLGTKMCLVGVGSARQGVEKFTVTPTEAINKLIKSITAQGIDLVSITPFFQNLPNALNPDAVGHTYIYLRFRFKEGSDLWVFSEADGNSDINKASGDIPYQSYPVAPPKK